MKRGKVYITGAGPGDPDLITIKGLRTIQEADVIFYDRLISEELLNYAKNDVDLIFCGKRPNYHAIEQQSINQLLVNHARKGKIVTRLKGGDPFVFGRGGEEAEFLLKNNIPYEIIPGITSGVAAPSYAGIPVTHRDYSRSFAMITGHQGDPETDSIKWDSLAKGIDTIAIYMGIKNLPYICDQLITHGKSADTPAALVYCGTTEKQRTVVGTLNTLETLAKQYQIKNPSIIIVGEVVNLSDKLAWFHTNENVHATFRHVF